MENNFEPCRILQAEALRMRRADTNKELSDVNPTGCSEHA
jgi:hypothetical protein